MSGKFRKAERKKARLRMGIAGPSGAGKTYSSLLIAYGIAGDWEKIAVIDTEHGSADLYADLGPYAVCPIEAPYLPDKYTNLIQEAEKEGFEVVVIDSLSHAWAGEGGLLDMKDKIAESGKGNSYTAWKTVTPKHNQLVESILKSKCHIIATMRSKTEYVLVEETNSNGRKVQTPKKVGMAPIQRDGMEYEFTVFMDLSHEHIASASKDRTGLIDGQYLKPSIELGQQLNAWLEKGIEVKAETPANNEEKPPSTSPGTTKQEHNPDDKPENFIVTITGKHKGETLDKVLQDDRGYVRWLALNCNNQKLKAAANEVFTISELKRLYTIGANSNWDNKKTKAWAIKASGKQITSLKELTILEIEKLIEELPLAIDSEQNNDMVAPPEEGPNIVDALTQSEQEGLAEFIENGDKFGV